MTPLDREELAELLKEQRISKRLIRDLRYVPEEITYPEFRDFLTIMNKSSSEGVLLYEEYIVPFSLTKRSANRSGRVEPIICDICASWRRGTGSAVLTFRKTATSSASFLVCLDLDCSLHVRDVTEVSKLSRTQLREHIAPEARIKRLNEKLDMLLKSVNK